MSIVNEFKTLYEHLKKLELPRSFYAYLALPHGFFALYTLFAWAFSYEDAPNNLTAKVIQFCLGAVFISLASSLPVIIVLSILNKTLKFPFLPVLYPEYVFIFAILIYKAILPLVQLSGGEPVSNSSKEFHEVIMDPPHTNIQELLQLVPADSIEEERFTRWFVLPSETLRWDIDHWDGLHLSYRAFENVNAVMAFYFEIYLKLGYEYVESYTHDCGRIAIWGDENNQVMYISFDSSGQSKTRVEMQLGEVWFECPTDININP